MGTQCIVNGTVRQLGKQGFIVLGQADDLAAQHQQCQKIGQDHQCIGQVGQIPDQFYLQYRTENDTAQYQQGIYAYCSGAQKVFHIDLPEQEPAGY